MQTPQRASIDATDAGDLVMRGVNGDGRGATADGRADDGRACASRLVSACSPLAARVRSARCGASSSAERTR